MELHRFTSFIHAKKQTDFFECFSKSCNPVTERLLGFVLVV